MDIYWREIIHLKAGSEEFTNLQVRSPDTGTLLCPHHLLPQLGEEVGLAVAREEAVLDLGEHGVGVRLAVALLPGSASGPGSEGV